MPAKKQKEFDWQKGSVLSNDLYDPLGNVRDIGFTKLADGILADPVRRKEVRKGKLTRFPSKKGSEVLIEGSEAGLSEDFTPSHASRILHKDSKAFKGIGRFSTPPASSKPPKK